MGFLGFGRSHIRFDMFDLPRSAEDARRMAKLSSLYHRGQELAWDGRAVLKELIAKHGGVRIDEGKREALGKIFGIIMWGELAAWRISLQLADEIVELEPKMAATSQAHDEARHFYVMYDYLSELGTVPKTMDRASRGVLDLVLETRSLAEKLLGMQLMVESMALTLFQAVRESRLEPVLADLLRYYEKDEARHVGLGVQLLPQLIHRMSKREGLGLFLFQIRVVGWTIAGLKSMEPHLRVLGIDPRRVLQLGRAKQLIVFQEMWDQVGIKDIPKSRQLVVQLINGITEGLFTPDARGLARVGRFVAGWQSALDTELPPTAIDPEAEQQRIVLKKGRVVQS
jgi:hypothetical protein